MRPPTPTDSSRPVDEQLALWRRIFAGDHYAYGSEPGPMARRAVRYHRPYLAEGGSALDVGCGEGQDLAFLAKCGYQVTGVDFCAEAAVKARSLLERRGFTGTVLESDLNLYRAEGQYDLVLAVNAVQFLGERASDCLDWVRDAVAPGGVIGLSLFGCEREAPRLAGTMFFITLEELLARFEGWQYQEATEVWQWHPQTSRPQRFVTLVARRLE